MGSFGVGFLLQLGIVSLSCQAAQPELPIHRLLRWNSPPNAQDLSLRFHPGRGPLHKTDSPSLISRHYGWILLTAGRTQFATG